MAYRKTVAGIKLVKTIGRNHYRWACSLAGLSVIFTPLLGRFNGRVNGWQFSCHHPGMGTTRTVQLGIDERGRPTYAAGSANSLTNAVIQAQHKATEARQFAVRGSLS